MYILILLNRDNYLQNDDVTEFSDQFIQFRGNCFTWSAPYSEEVDYNQFVACIGEFGVQVSLKKRFFNKNKNHSFGIYCINILLLYYPRVCLDIIKSSRVIQIV